MRIQIQSLAFPLTAALLDHTEGRVRGALARITSRIGRIVVRLGNTGGQRGAENNYCRIQVFLEDAPPVLIEDIGGNLYAAIDRAAERAGRNVVRGLYRLHERNGRPSRPQPPR